MIPVVRGLLNNPAELRQFREQLVPTGIAWVHHCNILGTVPKLLHSRSKAYRRPHWFQNQTPQLSFLPGIRTFGKPTGDVSLAVPRFEQVIHSPNCPQFLFIGDYGMEPEPRGSRSRFLPRHPTVSKSVARARIPRTLLREA